MKKKIICIVVIMLMATFFSASAATNTFFKINYSENSIIVKQPVPIIFDMENKPFFQPTRIHTSKSPRLSEFGTDFQVTNFGENDSHPNIAIDSDGNPIIVYDHDTGEGYHEIYLQRSLDGGGTWPEDQRYYLAGTTDLSAVKPVIDLYDHGKSGVVIFQTEEMYPHIYGMEIVDIDNPSTWFQDSFTLSMVSDWVGETTAALYHDCTYVTGAIGDMIWGEYNVSETFHIYWAADINDQNTTGGLFYIIDEDVWCSHPTVAATRDYLYGAAQFNEPDRSKVRVSRSPTDDPIFDNWKGAWITSPGNITNPRIAASEPYAYCVVQDDRYGNEDVSCYTPATPYWTKHVIADSSDDETYPSITAFGKTAICTFVKNGNLYSSKTEDGGETWSTPEQINDENDKVFGDYRCADVEGPYMAWTDDRNDNKDVYCDVTEMPWIAIRDVSGGFGVSAEIANIGTADAQDVGCEIHVVGGMRGFINKTVSKTIDIETGTSEKVKTGVFLGFGQIAIDVVSGGLKLDNLSGKQFIIFTVVQ